MRPVETGFIKRNKGEKWRGEVNLPKIYCKCF
jgi:hypothetical protein